MERSKIDDREKELKNWTIDAFPFVEDDSDYLVHRDPLPTAFEVHLDGSPLRNVVAFKQARTSGWAIVLENGVDRNRGVKYSRLEIYHGDIKKVKLVW
jgi:hypothetical protein